MSELRKGSGGRLDRTYRAQTWVAGDFPLGLRSWKLSKKSKRHPYFPAFFCWRKWPVISLTNCVLHRVSGWWPCWWEMLPGTLLRHYLFLLPDNLISSCIFFWVWERCVEKMINGGGGTNIAMKTERDRRNHKMSGRSPSWCLHSRSASMSPGVLVVDRRTPEGGARQCSQSQVQSSLGL